MRREPVRWPNRLFEWVMAANMIGIAMTVAASPAALGNGGFYLLHNLGLATLGLTLFFWFAGLMRAVALYANGHWPVYGPWCRAAGAAAGALIWTQMSISLVHWSGQSGYVSLGVPVYISLAIGELISCYRAASDVRAAA